MIPPKISAPPIAVHRLIFTVLKNKKLKRMTNSGYDISMSEATVAFFPFIASSMVAFATRKRTVTKISIRKVFLSLTYSLILKEYFPKTIINVQKIKLNIVEKKHSTTIGTWTRSLSSIAYTTHRDTDTTRARMIRIFILQYLKSFLVHRLFFLVLLWFGLLFFHQL